MATFWLLLATALCGLHFVINEDILDGDTDGPIEASFPETEDDSAYSSPTGGCGCFRSFSEQVSR